nr:putative reverse transcriptase domain-containing protein [Tanacetum cinerariifolium]
MAYVYALLDRKGYAYPMLHDLLDRKRYAYPMLHDLLDRNGYTYPMIYDLLDQKGYAYPMLCDLLDWRGKANIVADALSRKEKVKPKRVRAMSITLQFSIKEKLLAAQNEVIKEENAPTKMLRSLDQQMEKEGRWSRLIDDSYEEKMVLVELIDKKESATNLKRLLKEKPMMRVGDDIIMFRSDNPTSNIIRRVYALELRERMELDLKARQMGEALNLNRSLDPVYEDYIELNDLNEPLELRRNQVVDLGLTINKGEVTDEPMKDIVKTRKDKIEYKGKNVVGAFINVSIFVGNFSVVTDFAVVENMDAYRDKGIVSVAERLLLLMEFQLSNG